MQSSEQRTHGQRQPFKTVCELKLSERNKIIDKIY